MRPVRLSLLGSRFNSAGSVSVFLFRFRYIFLLLELPLFSRLPPPPAAAAAITSEMSFSLDSKDAYAYVPVVCVSSFVLFVSSSLESKAVL